MGADLDLIQGAVVFALTVMGALTDSAFNGLVGMTIHNENPPFIWVLP